MKVFLVRHADADAELPEGLGDEARTLTARARVAIGGHFAALADRIGTVDRIFTSPLARCVQTAQLLATSLRYEGSLKAHRSLLPDGPVGALATLLLEHVGSSVVLVGHQPSMGAMAAHLLGMSSFPKPVTPGTVIGLEWVVERDAERAPAARLIFFAGPQASVLESLSL